MSRDMILSTTVLPCAKIAFAAGLKTTYEKRRRILLNSFPLLTDPASHGGEAADAFDVVVPSLPGYGFSDRLPSSTEFTFGSLFHRLMADLGYDRYGAHGGDIGSSVCEQMARSHADRLVGIHLTDVPVQHALVETGGRQVGFVLPQHLGHVRLHRGGNVDRSGGRGGRLAIGEVEFVLHDLDRDVLVRIQRREASDEVLQFSDVSRPGVAPEGLERLRRQGDGSPPVFLAVPLEE